MTHQELLDHFAHMHDEMLKAESEAREADNSLSASIFKAKAQTWELAYQHLKQSNENASS